MDLGASAGSIVEEVTELAAVGLDVDSTLGGPGIALENQDLVFWSTLLLYGVHRARAPVELGPVMLLESSWERSRRCWEARGRGRWCRRAEAVDKIKDGREGDDAAKEAGGDLLDRTVSMGGQLGMDLEGIDFLGTGGTEAGSTRKVPTVFFFSAQRSGMGKRERESATRIFVVVGDDCAC